MWYVRVTKSLPLNPARILGGGGGTISSPTSSDESSREIGRLLAQTRVVRDACDFDLLMFLHRHPRALLTSEQLTAFVGYDIKRVAKSLDAFLDAGLLERTQNPMHAARLYLLVLDGPEGGGLVALLKLASTPQGRRAILRALPTARLRTDPGAVQGKRRLLKIA